MNKRKFTFGVIQELTFFWYDLLKSIRIFLWSVVGLWPSRVRCFSTGARDFFGQKRKDFLQRNFSLGYTTYDVSVVRHAHHLCEAICCFVIKLQQQKNAVKSPHHVIADNTKTFNPDLKSSAIFNQHQSKKIKQIISAIIVTKLLVTKPAF